MRRRYERRSPWSSIALGAVGCLAVVGLVAMVWVAIAVFWITR
jgi:hypothetical protein